jgi:hypothetical protein
MSSAALVVSVFLSQVDWDLILLMEPPTLLGAIAGSYINKLLPVWISHILLAVLLTLMTIRVVQRACRIYHRESASNMQAAQPSSSGPTAAAQAADQTAQGVITEGAANGSLAPVTSDPCRPLCSNSITSGSGCSNQDPDRLADADAVVQLSALSASGAAVATGSSTMISSATMSRRRSRPLLSASQQQLHSSSTAAAGDPHQAEDRPTSAPSLAAAVVPAATRLPSSTLIPLEIEGNISEEVLGQLVARQASPRHWLTPPPAAAAAAAAATEGDGRPGYGEILLQGAAALPRLHSSSAPSGNGTHHHHKQQQQPQPPQEPDEVLPPCPAECKLLYAPPEHTRR